MTFQSTRPIRGATEKIAKRVASTAFQSTRPIRGATHRFVQGIPDRDISIHAPHTGRDYGILVLPLRTTISIHAPHTGRDSYDEDHLRDLVEFQSTRPIRGATSSMRAGDSGPGYFNPRAPYGARRIQGYRQKTQDNISIHAPHTGRDRRVSRLFDKLRYFNPRAPYGARLLFLLRSRHSSDISIHAPHTGRD